jgi:hypothetical protein
MAIGYPLSVDRLDDKRMYRIYRELELNLRIKPRKRLVRQTPQPLVVPVSVNAVWSMDFMHDQLKDGRSIRLLNVIDDFNREALASRSTSPYPQRVSYVLWSRSSAGGGSQRRYGAITALST